MYDVSDEAKQASTECKHGFSCLEGNQKAPCEMEECVDRTIHFVRYLNEGVCPYQQAFGNGWACTCPVRKELYNRYKV